jgi:hypothetical protein
MAKRRRILWVVPLLLLAASSARAEEPSPPDSVGTDSELSDELFAQLDELKCKDLDSFAYQTVPGYVLDGKPDQLYEFSLYWEARCGRSEPLTRMLILGSIWDDAFDEAIYDYGIIDALVDRYDPERKSATPELKQDFDAFTSDFADQLLPHVAYRSLEAFFCLFYAGQTEEAWDLLKSGDLEETWLRYYHDEEMQRLGRSKGVANVMLTVGPWTPDGNMDFVGDKVLIGMTGGMRWPRWLLRVALEVRVGRSLQPYFVNEDGYRGRSDRFDAYYFGLEFGYIAWKPGRHAVDAFVGVGLDGVRPFIDEDLVLATYNASVGLGYRYSLGRYEEFLLGLDVRREWVGERNELGQSLSGGAWSARFGIGYSFNKSKARRLNGLGR